MMMEQMSKEELEAKLRNYPNPIKTGVNHMADRLEIFDEITGKIIGLVKSEYFTGEKTYHFIDGDE